MRIQTKYITIVLLLAIFLLHSSFAIASVFSLSSSPVYEVSAKLGLELEYTDNVNNLATNKQNAFITRVLPQFSFKRLGSRLEADINYLGNYSYNLEKSLEQEYQHTIDANINAHIIENLFSISLNENMQQVYEDITLGGFEAFENADNSRNRNIITISPTFSLQPTSRTNVAFGYNFTDTRYSLSYITPTPSFLSLDSEQYTFKYNVNQAHNPFFRINHSLSERTSLYLGGGYTRQLYDDENSIDLSRYNMYLGGSYIFSDNFTANVELGPDYSVPDNGSSVLSPYGQVSLNYILGKSTFTLSYNTSFEDDIETGETLNKSTYLFSWNKLFNRSNLLLSLTYNTFTANIPYIQTGVNQEQQSNTLVPRIQFKYDLTQRASIQLSYSATLYEDYKTNANKHTTDNSITYLLSENSNIQLAYDFQYTSPYNTKAYYTNQLTFNFTHSF